MDVTSGSYTTAVISNINITGDHLKQINCGIIIKSAINIKKNYCCTLIKKLLKSKSSCYDLQYHNTNEVSLCRRHI